MIADDAYIITHGHKLTSIINFNANFSISILKKFDLMDVKTMLNIKK